MLDVVKVFKNSDDNFFKQILLSIELDDWSSGGTKYLLMLIKSTTYEYLNYQLKLLLFK